MGASKISSHDNSRQNYKPHRLRDAFIFATAIAFTGLIVAFVSAIRHLEQSHIQQRLVEEYWIAQESVAIQTNDTKKLLAALSSEICSNREAQAIWLEGNREELLEHTIPIYESLFQAADVTHLYFHALDGVNFLRVHRPPSFGDKIERAMQKEAEKTGKPAYGIELGKFGTLTFRYVCPWYIDGKLTGYVELGKDIESIYRGATKLLGGNSAILLNKKNLNEEDWKQGMDFLQRAGDWGQYRDYVAVSQYPADYPLEFIPQLLNRADSPGKLPSESFCDVDDKVFQVGALELRDMLDRPVGYFVFAKDVTASFVEMRHSAEVLVGSTILVAILIAFLGARLLSKVENRVHHEHQKVQNQLAVEHLQSNIIARFVDYDPKEWESHLHQSLQEVCDFSNASAVYTIGYSETERMLSDLYGWSVKYGTGGITFFQEFEYEDVLWWIEMLNQGEPVVVTGDAIPPEAEVPQKLYARFHAKSILVVPMIYSGKVRGCLLISHQEAPMNWQPGQIHCMKSVANIFAIAIMRQHVEASVQEYTEKLAQNNIGLKLARAEAEEAARTKSDFLANMSHEIRTPMTAILGFAENLITPTINDKDRIEAADTIYRNGKHLLQLINDILDFSKVEAGHIKIEKISFPPMRIVSDVVSLMKKRAEEKNLFLKFEFLSSMPLECETDPTRLRQILLNLVGNAIKFTDEGGVMILASMEKTEKSQGRFVCEVHDTGVGMEESQVKRVFQPFTQADNSVARRYGGTGLGLAISLRLTEAMGGALTVKSVQEVSTTFRMVIPVVIREEMTWIDSPNQYQFALPVDVVKEKAETLPGALKYKILLAEDGKDNQRLISLLLCKEGAMVEIAENGSEAILAVEQADVAGEPFDLVLMDMQMPVLDGYAATRRLRQAGFRLPIVALTASVMPEDRNKCIVAGCDDYATKPINREVLFRTILENIDKNPAVF